MNEFDNNTFPENQNETEQNNTYESAPQDTMAQNPYPDDTYRQAQQERNTYAWEQQQERDPYRQASYQAYQERRKKKSVRGIKSIRKVGAAVAFGAIAGITMLGVNAVGSHFINSNASRIETTTTTSGSDDKTNSGTSDISATGISTIVNNVMPSVVSITSTIESTNYWGMSSESEGAGSGFIIAKTKDKLMIATNNHVVADSKSLTVGFIDGETVSAEIVGTDATGDLAVISVNLKDIKEDTASQIKIATLGDSSKMNVGDTVIAIGNALGYGQSVTTGVLSAKDREVSFTDGTMTLLQTDAAINPGNSGGVLINTSGEVIGINNAKLADTEVEGMGYAIPMATAKETLDEIMNSGSIEESDLAYLGIVGRTIDSTYSEALGIPAGVYVTQVVKDSPAEKAGINAGDVVVKIDDASITSMENLKGKINLKKAGTKVTITVKRADQNGEYSEKKLKVTLGKRGDYVDATTESTENQTQQQNGQQGQDNNGSQYYFNDGGNNNNSNDQSIEDYYRQFFGQ